MRRDKRIVFIAYSYLHFCVTVFFLIVCTQFGQIGLIFKRFILSIDNGSGKVEVLSTTQISTTEALKSKAVFRHT